MAIYGNVYFVRNYVEAPEYAKYIIRELNSGEIILEEYDRLKTSTILHSFGNNALLRNSIQKTLEDARAIINCDNTIYVEKPFWMYSPLELQQQYEDMMQY